MWINHENVSFIYHHIRAIFSQTFWCDCFCFCHACQHVVLQFLQIKVSKHWKLVFQFCFDKTDTDAVSTFQLVNWTVGSSNWFLIAIDCKQFVVCFFTIVWPCIITDSLWIKPTDALKSNFIGIITLHVSDSLSAHHQEFLAVHWLWYILCSCDDCLLPEVGWNCKAFPSYSW